MTPKTERLFSHSGFLKNALELGSNVAPNTRPTLRRDRLARFRPVEMATHTAATGGPPNFTIVASCLAVVEETRTVEMILRSTFDVGTFMVQNVDGTHLT